MPRGMKKGLNTQKFDSCVSKVKSRSGKKANPYAVGHKIIENQKIIRIDSQKLCRLATN